MSITTATRSSSYIATKIDGLGARQRLILDKMNENKERQYTARELAKELYAEGKVSSPERNQTHPRLNELVKCGKIVVVGVRKDVATNRNVAIYAIPNHTD